MSLNLIPPTHSYEKKKSHLGVFSLKKTANPKRLMVWGGFFLGIILIFLFYFVVRIYKSSLNKKLQTLSNEAQEIKKEKIALRRSSGLGDFQAKVDALSNLIKNHIYWTEFFNFLERNTTSKVQFTTFSADANSGRLDLEGNTPTFTDLAGQMITLKKQKLVEQLRLTSLRISDEGIKFHFSIQLNPDAWKKIKLNNNNNEL